MSSLPWKKLQNFVEGKKVVVFGLGLQGGGVGVANTLVHAGALVHVIDSKPASQLQDSINQLHSGITLEFGEELRVPEDTFLIIKNPAVPYEHPLIQEALEKHLAITTEAALALHCMRDHAIGITGTRGKTTTTTLTHAILLEAGFDAILCGNIPGLPLLAALEQSTETSIFVVELSSFQIEGCIRDEVSPHIAVVTNIYPDHLNRYESIEAYAQTKAGLLSWQKPGDFAVIANWHDWTETLQQSIQDGVIACTLSQEELERATSFTTLLPGDHNKENIAFATKITEILGVPTQALRVALATFQGVPFRLEVVAHKNNITYINDTTSTTPIALEKAMEAQKEPYVLILGGTTKHLPLSTKLLELLQTSPESVVALSGSGTSELLERMGERASNWHVTSNIDEAVKEAEERAERLGLKNILFSPGFSSFELFANEFDRGRQFNALVQTS